MAGSRRVGDAPFDEIFHPISRRLAVHCDAIVRIGGPSAGADEMVELARAAGKLVVTEVAALPPAH
jgi:molybdopterin biosynthesis enzyme